MDHCQESGGVVLACPSYLQSFVVAHGSEPKDRCVWMTLMMVSNLDKAMCHLCSQIHLKVWLTLRLYGFFTPSDGLDS